MQLYRLTFFIYKIPPTNSSVNSTRFLDNSKTSIYLKDIFMLLQQQSNNYMKTSLHLVFEGKNKHTVN